MPRKTHCLDSDQLDQIKALRAEGHSLAAIAKTIGVSKTWLGTQPFITDCPKPNRRVPIPQATIQAALDLYASGIGAIAVAKQLNIPVTAFKRILGEQGIPLRGRSAQQFARMGRLDPADRLALAEAAHAAVRGMKHTDATLQRRAQARCKSSSIAEDRVADELQQRGIEFDRQAPIDRYNADFLIQPAGAGSLPVAMEIFGGHWHRYGNHARIFPERSRKILGSHHLLIVWIAPGFSLSDGLEHAITQLELMRRLPATVGQYRVVWGHLGLTAIGSAQDVERALIPPTTCRRNPATGRYQSVSRDAVPM